MGHGCQRGSVCTKARDWLQTGLARGCEAPLLGMKEGGRGEHASLSGNGSPLHPSDFGRACTCA